MGDLRRQWPTSLLTGMTRQQTDLETLRWEGFGSEYYHLDLGQLWRCPVSWCTQWKGTSQDCIDHIRAQHHGENGESGKVVPTLDSNSSDVECGVEA